MSSAKSNSKYESPRKWIPKFCKHADAKSTASCSNRFSALLLPTPSSSTINGDFESHVSKIDSEQWSAEQFCPICYEEYDVFDFLALECSHQFHSACLECYVKKSKKSTCPMCRRFSLTLNDIYLNDILKRSHVQRQRTLAEDWRGLFNLHQSLRDVFHLDAFYARHDAEFDLQFDDAEEDRIDMTDEEMIERRPITVGCSALNFTGRAILAASYIGFLYWHRDSPRFSTAMDNAVCRSFLSAGLATYLMSTSVAKSLNVPYNSVGMVIPRAINFCFESALPFTISTYYSYAVLSPYSLFVVDSLCYGVCVVTGFVVTQFAFVGFFHGLHFLVAGQANIR